MQLMRRVVALVAIITVCSGPRGHPSRSDQPYITHGGRQAVYFSLLYMYTHTSRNSRSRSRSRQGRQAAGSRQAAGRHTPRVYAEMVTVSFWLYSKLREASFASSWLLVRCARLRLWRLMPSLFHTCTHLVHTCELGFAPSIPLHYLIF